MARRREDHPAAAEAAGRGGHGHRARPGGGDAGVAPRQAALGRVRAVRSAGAAGPQRPQRMGVVPRHPGGAAAADHVAVAGPHARVAVVEPDRGGRRRPAPRAHGGRQRRAVVQQPLRRRRHRQRVRRPARGALAIRGAGGRRAVRGARRGHAAIPVRPQREDHRHRLRPAVPGAPDRSGVGPAPGCGPPDGRPVVRPALPGQGHRRLPVPHPAPQHRRGPQQRRVGHDDVRRRARLSARHVFAQQLDAKPRGQAARGAQAGDRAAPRAPSGGRRARADVRGPQGGGQLLGPARRRGAGAVRPGRAPWRQPGAAAARGRRGAG
ncbi:MAG: hypothetical protein EBV07_00915 [Proteobacteria bacterium]|nr:hypothetical protein [Pseudomonadota bacterium]